MPVLCPENGVFLSDAQLAKITDDTPHEQDDARATLEKLLAFILKKSVCKKFCPLTLEGRTCALHEGGMEGLEKYTEMLNELNIQFNAEGMRSRTEPPQPSPD